MLGKQKCKILKEIRQRIADENDIPYVTRECRFQGECSGTCPRCESELRYLEQQLKLRASMGKRVAVTALCAGMAFASAGCGSSQAGPDPATDELSGAVAPYEEKQENDPQPQVEVLSGEVAWPEPQESSSFLPADSVGKDSLPPEAHNRSCDPSGVDALPADDPEPEPIEFELMGDVAYNWDDTGSN